MDATIGLASEIEFMSSLCSASESTYFLWKKLLAGKCAQSLRSACHLHRNELLKKEALDESLWQCYHGIRLFAQSSELEESVAQKFFDKANSLLALASDNMDPFASLGVSGNKSFSDVAAQDLLAGCEDLRAILALVPLCNFSGLPDCVGNTCRACAAHAGIQLEALAYALRTEREGKTSGKMASVCLCATVLVLSHCQVFLAQNSGGAAKNAKTKIDAYVKKIGFYVSKILT